jgi:hypothetical protein
MMRKVKRRLELGRGWVVRVEAWEVGEGRHIHAVEVAEAVVLGAEVHA